MQTSHKVIYYSEPVSITEQTWEEDVIPLVSISCITYNHATYICEAIDSFLMQKTTFPVEILIHDDASIDGTSKIIREYENKYPKLIYPIYQLENQYSQGIRSIMAKFNFPRAHGKYIATCEGDDYWTDPLKLQKQVDFLERNAKYVLCFHKIKALVGDKPQEDEVIEKRYQEIINKNEITTLDLLKHGNFIHTGSVLFRNKHIEFPFEFDYSPVGDYFLFILLSEMGLLFRLNEYMGVYRRGTGVYSTLSPIDMQRKIVQYHIAILSYLSDDEQKKIFLQGTIKMLFNFEKTLLDQAYEKEKIAEYTNWKDLINALVYKTIKKLTL